MSPFCSALLLFNMASSYTIVWTTYCLVIAIVSDSPIMLTYAHY
jgi:hypothetical protein